MMGDNTYGPSACRYGQPTRGFDPSPGHLAAKKEPTCSPVEAVSSTWSAQAPVPQWLDHGAPPTQWPLPCLFILTPSVFPHSRPSFCLFLTLPHPRPRSITHPSYFPFLPSLTPPSFKASTFAIFLFLILESFSLCCATRSRVQPPPKLSFSLQYTQNLQYEEKAKNNTPGQNRTIRALKIKPDDDETSKEELIQSPETNPFTAFE